jgi:hypothetical protein
MSLDRAKLLEDALRLRGIKTAREIGAMHGVSRCVVIGLWWRAKLPKVPMKTRGRLVSRPNLPLRQSLNLIGGQRNIWGRHEKFFESL